MDALLTLLLDRFDRDSALPLLRDRDARNDVASSIAGDLVTAGMPHGMLDTSEGENLFLAVLTLRVKFSAEEAREKVRLNIAMREGRA